MCSRRVYAGNLESPPEYCDNEAEPGEELCAEHLYEDDPWDRADEAYERQKERYWDD